MDISEICYKDPLFLNMDNIKSITLFNDIIDNKYNSKKYDLKFENKEDGTLVYFDNLGYDDSIKNLLNNFNLLEIKNNNDEINKFLLLFNYTDTDKKITKIFLDDKNYFN